MVRKTDRYADLEDGGRSEYGGGEVNQRYPDGSSRPLSEIPSAVSEQARLMRQAGINDYDPDPQTDIPLAMLTGLEYSKMSAAQKEAYDLDKQLYDERVARRNRLQTATNGYIDEPDQYVGEAAPTDAGANTGIKASIERNAAP